MFYSLSEVYDSVTTPRWSDLPADGVQFQHVYDSNGNITAAALNTFYFYVPSSGVYGSSSDHVEETDIALRRIAFDSRSLAAESDADRVESLLRTRIDAALDLTVSPASIEARYPGALVKLGKWTTYEDFNAIQALAQSFKDAP